MSLSMDIKPGEAVAFVSGLAASSAGAAAPAATAILPVAVAVVPATAPVAGVDATTAALLHYDSLRRGQLLMS